MRGALLGAALTSGTAAIGVVLLRNAPAIIGRPVLYEPLLRVTGDDLVWHITFFLSLGAVLGGVVDDLYHHHPGLHVIAISCLETSFWKPLFIL